MKSLLAGFLFGGLLLAGISCARHQPLVKASQSRALPETGVCFKTADGALQRLFDLAEAKAASNVVQFTPALKILVEGGGYQNAWIETQPMGGEMYAARDPEVALNNQLIFMQAQRADGRLPGMVVSGAVARKKGSDQKPPEGMAWMPHADVLADFEMFQGYCFPEPAWRTYFWIGKDHAYLRKLYAALASHDAYLWRTRDSNGDGLLETWCVWDTGEDASTRLLTRGAPTSWPFDQPPGAPGLPTPQNPAHYKRYWGEPGQEKFTAANEPLLAPFASMDVMAYSYAGRATLAKIARELNNSRAADFWNQLAEEVRQRLIAQLWDAQRHACFDRDSQGRVLPELIHNNLRCMWYGIFTQEMADAFIREHLLNPAEFWTPLPLPSIAVNEPLFRNAKGNNWSGQPEGLTYQRAIAALENYGHHAEVALLGGKLLAAVAPEGRFTQQFDPFTGTPNAGRKDGYGPTILAVLEYISRRSGIHLDVVNDRVWWSALSDAPDFSYTQRWGQREWTLTATAGQMRATLNGREVFTGTTGCRIVTDLEGNLREVVGIDSRPQQVFVRGGGSQHGLTVAPNQVYRLSGGKAELARAVPFDFPYRPR